MNPISFQDCYATLDNGTLTIGNSRVERTFLWHRGDFASLALLDKETGETWALNNPVATAPAPASSSWNADAAIIDGEHLRLTLTLTSLQQVSEITLSIFPETPFVTLERRHRGTAAHDHTEQADDTASGVEAASAAGATPFLPNTYDIVPLGRRHLKVTAFRLHDRTDNNDTLLTSEERFTYQNWSGYVQGSLFLVTNPLSQRAVLAVNESPNVTCDLVAERVGAFLKGHDFLALGTGAICDTSLEPDEWQHDYGSTVGVGETQALLREFKRLYRRQTRDCGSETFIMSNTWGDRNQDARVSEAFIRGEIEAAHRLGIDIVQIDDGWQQGATANSKIAASNVWSGGFYQADPHFWDVHPQKFPHGLEPLVHLARQLHVTLGLWFSPDSSHDFRNWRQDADNLLRLHRLHGVTYFKIDGVKLTSKLGENNFLNFLEAVSRESGNAIHINLDITAQSRLGYLYQRQFGTLFVENRYSDWQNYYPHATLRNVWSLARLLPLNRFQFEFLNNARNIERYGDDPLAPCHYPLSYQFASVMLANPLAWMELTSLTTAQQDELQAAIRLYRHLRPQLTTADITPIGACPDGCSFTGFQVTAADSTTFLLLFRELTAQATTVFTLAQPLPATSRARLVSASTPDVRHVLLDHGHMQVTMPQPRSWCLISC